MIYLKEKQIPREFLPLYISAQLTSSREPYLISSISEKFYDCHGLDYVRDTL